MGSTQQELEDISPRPPSPLYPDVPWWAVLITAFVFSALGIVIGVYAGMLPKPPPGTGMGTLGALMLDTISYMPHVILLFGVLADMFTLQGVWSIPSLIGLLSVFANYVFEYFWKGLDELGERARNVGQKISQSGKGVSTEKVKGGAGKLFTEYNGCSIQGLEDWNTPYAPQTLVVTATVFSYYCFDLIANRGWINSIGGLVAFLLAYVAQTAIIAINTDSVGCTTRDGRVLSPTSQGIRAFFEGLLFGGVSYAVVQTYAPTRLPTATISPFPLRSASDLTPGPDGRMYDKDGYPYVILPNGQAVPDVSDARARAAFGAMAASATGAPPPATGSGCPGRSPACPNAS